MLEALSVMTHQERVVLQLQKRDNADFMICIYTTATDRKWLPALLEGLHTAAGCSSSAERAAALHFICSLSDLRVSTSVITSPLQNNCCPDLKLRIILNSNETLTKREHIKMRSPMQFLIEKYHLQENAALRWNTCIWSIEPQLYTDMLSSFILFSWMWFYASKKPEACLSHEARFHFTGPQFDHKGLIWLHEPSCHYTKSALD